MARQRLIISHVFKMLQCDSGYGFRSQIAANRPQNRHKQSLAVSKGAAEKFEGSVRAARPRRWVRCSATTVQRVTLQRSIQPSHSL